MFSEALRIMDRNTTKYMIDDLTKRCNDAEAQRDDAVSKLSATEAQRDDAVSKLSLTEAALDKSQQENAELKAQLAAYKASSSNTTV